MKDLDRWLDMTSYCLYLPENELKELCRIVSEICLEESNVQPVQTPVTIVGDIHGQYYDLEELLRLGGKPPQTRYIFMGDYVDRGYYSLETITRLFALKARYPAHMTLLRGNHETRRISSVYGFYDECLKKYGNPNGWRYFCDAFDKLPIAAIVQESVLCLHGGLSPQLNTIDQIRTLERVKEPQERDALSDLLWSDPANIRNWMHSPRGCGYLFGSCVTEEFLKINNLKLLCRAHQLVDKGLSFIFNGKVITVWSAPNYCYRCGNDAAMLTFDDDLNYSGKIFRAVADDRRNRPTKSVTPYFL